MVDAKREALELRVQSKVGQISNVAKLSDDALEAIESGALARNQDAQPLPYVSLDTRPLHEQIIGFRLW